METWIIGIILAAVEVIVTTTAGFVITRILNKKAKDKEELAALRESSKKEAEQKRYNVIEQKMHEEIITLGKTFSEKVTEKYDEIQKDIADVKGDLTVVKKGLQNDLYVDLVNLYHIYTERGYATIEEKRDYDSLYFSYHNLGKNGIADEMLKKVRGLPDSPKGE